jgi:transcriptional antiterminator RfaH
MTFHDREQCWYLAQLKPNCWHIADRNLKRQGFKTFLPIEDVTRRVRDRFVTSQRPLFQGYLFVAFNSSTDYWRSINSTYGVSRIVSFGSIPCPVPNEIVTGLQVRCDEGGVLLPPRILKPGEEVRVTSGPLANFVGTVETLAPEQRVWILIDIMGGSTRVAVDADRLQIK